MDQARRTAYKSTHVDDIFGPEFDRIWPSKQATSVRRYRAPGETRTEKTYAVADVMMSGATELPNTTPSRKSGIPARSTASVPAIRQTSSMQTLSAAPRREAEIITQTQRGGYPRKKSDRPQTHWLVYVGASMLAMTLGWVLLSSVSGWGQEKLDDWRYGRPRTVHIEQVVGHNDSESKPSHFIVTNYKGQIQVVEFPGGDPTKVKIYVGPVLNGSGHELIPVIPEFKDVNGDDKLDLILSAKDVKFIFINENGQYRALKADEPYKL